MDEEEVEGLPVQARSEETGMHYFASVGEAFRYVQTDPTVWKVSFPDFNGGRVRLIHQRYMNGSYWSYEPMEDEIAEALGKE